MSKKKTENKKSPYPENGKVKIRHSYYTFSRDFPSKIMPIEGKRKKGKKQRILKKVLSGFLFVLLTAVSFFAVNVLIDISYTDKDKLDSLSTHSVGSSEEAEKPVPFGGENIRSLYMPAEKLGDRKYIKDFIKQIRIKNCNSVVIDFKNYEGRLSYTSFNEKAIVAHCALFDNNTVRQALDLFEDEKIKVIARVYCFADNIIATENPDLAVKYMDTDVNWVDTGSEGTGKSRLNPVSKDTRKYLTDIIKEIAEFKIDGVLLEEVSFPVGEFVSSASYPGEKKSSDRNKVLKDFIGEIKKSVPEDCIVLMGQTANDILEGNKDLYFGDILSSSVDGFSVDTKERDESVIVDKKTDFVSIFSMFSSIKNKTAKKTDVYKIDISEYSASYIRKMKKAGYTDFIIYSEDGIYS